MFNTDDVVVYIAGAGSGKTTALMSELVGMLKVYRPDEVAFTTFTRKGVFTGIERALNSNASLSAEDLVYFETLHRMCFREAGMQRKNILENRDILKFNSLLGFKLHFSSAFDMQTDDDKMLQRYNAQRSEVRSGIIVESMYDEARYIRFINAYEKFKSENDLVDFYDCLMRYRDYGTPLPISAFFLDEAQDVTPLQWEVIQLASKNAERVRVGGDPAQSIFSFQGSVPETLIELAKNNRTIELNSTYRLPRKLCTVADSIIDLMEVKMKRQHIAVRNVDGHIQELSDRTILSRIIKNDVTKNGLKPYRWFCLFRTNYHIADMAKLLSSMLIPYHTSKGFCLDERGLNRIARYYKYRLDGYGEEKSKAKFMKDYGIEDFSLCFTESSIIPGEDRYTYLDYIEKYGLKELLGLSTTAPSILLTTTYKVKGGEADNVAVFLDATKQVSDNVLLDLDGELRVFYVACTRAREALYMIQAESSCNITRLWEMTVENMGGLL